MLVLAALSDLAVTFMPAIRGVPCQCADHVSICDFFFAWLLLAEYEALCQLCPLRQVYL